MFTISGGILIAYICIAIGAVIGGGVWLLIKLGWTFAAPNADLKRAKIYRKKERIPNR